MGLFGNPEARVVKPAGKTTWRMTGSRGFGARQTMHVNEGEADLAKLAGKERREHEKPRGSKRP